MLAAIDIDISFAGPCNTSKTRIELTTTGRRRFALSRRYPNGTECDDAQIGAAFVYTDPDGMATVVRTEGGADAKVEWLRVLAAATGGDKAARVKVADYFGSAADAFVGR